MSGRAHATATLARLQQVATGVGIIDGDQSRGQLPPFPYVVVYPDTGLRRPARLSGEPGHVETVVQVVSCGSTPEQARWAADRVDTALGGWRPVISGRTCWRTTQEYAQAVRLDDDVHERPTYIATAGYRVVSE